MSLVKRKMIGRAPKRPVARWGRWAAGLAALTAVSIGGGASAAQAAQPFDPQITISVGTRTVSTPTSMTVEVLLPQNPDPDGQGTANLRDGIVSLPSGVSLSPSAANGLGSCSDAQMGLIAEDPDLEMNDDVPTCPQASKIGTVAIDTHVLDHPNGPGTPNLTGDIYLGEQKSNDPMSGSMYRIWLYVKAPGVMIKLLGRVRVNPETGVITTSFERAPQLPFTRLTLSFKGGPDAPLTSPPTCGRVYAEATFVPWSTPHNATQFRSAPIDFDVPADGLFHCPTALSMRPFDPGVSIGSRSRVAGTFSPLDLSILRNDSEQELHALTMELPPGMLARLRDVPVCTNVRPDEDTCDPASRVGSATTGTGAGAEPFYIRDQPVYLTGPYKGAPYGLAVAVRAIAGPFDLGTVVVRQALFVDPTDAHVRVVSDPFPTILKGVPLDIRRIDVSMDRPGFTNTPTSCGAKSISVGVRSLYGAVSNKAIPYQATGCDRLGFAPKLTLSLTRKTEMTKDKHPDLEAELRMPQGGANIKAVTVKLPLSLSLDVKNAKGLCTYAQGQALNCPESSIIGYASAVSPLLKRPLAGPVYFVENVRYSSTGRAIPTLPSLLVRLHGEVDLNLRAHTEVEKNRLVTTFDNVPDAAVTEFNLKLIGGKNGILRTTSNLCDKPQYTTLGFVGQNNRRSDRTSVMPRECLPSSRVKVSSAKLSKGKARVRGTVVRGAKGKVRLSLRCGRKIVRKRVKAKNGRWSSVVRCAPKARKTKKGMRAPTVRAVASYASDATYRRTSSTRQIKLSQRERSAAIKRAKKAAAKKASKSARKSSRKK